MKRNIDVLKEMEKEVTNFKLAEDEISVYADIENMELDEVFEEDAEAFEEAYKPMKKIESMIKELTEDLKCRLEEHDIDIKSFFWIMAKIGKSRYEITNYMDDLINIADELEEFTSEEIQEYNIFVQPAYSEV